MVATRGITARDRVGGGATANAVLDLAPVAVACPLVGVEDGGGGRRDGAWSVALTDEKALDDAGDLADAAVLHRLGDEVARLFTRRSENEAISVVRYGEGADEVDLDVLKGDLSDDGAVRRAGGES